jgi:hypothetical protein
MRTIGFGGLAYTGVENVETIKLTYETKDTKFAVEAC